jgi:hypothetical protein
LRGGEAAERSQPDVKRLEISECEFRTEGAADIRSSAHLGRRGYRTTRSFASGYDLSAASPPKDTYRFSVLCRKQGRYANPFAHEGKP